MPSYPISVRYCRFCGDYSNKDETGFTSINLDEWFCNVTCYHQSRLSRGQVQIGNQGISSVLLKMREKNGIYDPEVIKSRKERAQERVRKGQLKFIRKTHAREDIPIQE